MNPLYALWRFSQLRVPESLTLCSTVLSATAFLDLHALLLSVCPCDYRLLVFQGSFLFCEASQETQDSNTSARFKTSAGRVCKEKPLITGSQSRLPFPAAINATYLLCMV